VYQTRGHTRRQKRGGVESWSGDNRLLGLLNLLRLPSLFVGLTGTSQAYSVTRNIWNDLGFLLALRVISLFLHALTCAVTARAECNSTRFTFEMSSTRDLVGLCTCADGTRDLVGLCTCAEFTLTLIDLRVHLRGRSAWQSAKWPGRCSAAEGTAACSARGRPPRQV